MDSNFDPFAQLYGRLMDENESECCKAEEWKFFTLSYNAGQTAELEVVGMDICGIDDWVEKMISSNKTPGVDLLLARHSQLGRQDVPARWMPFRPAHFRKVFRGLSLHEDFYDFRTYASESGGLAYHSWRDPKGELIGLKFLIRSAHSSVTTHGSNWSFALTWHASTGRTTGFLDGIADIDMSDLEKYLKSASPQLGHPLMLPEILLDMITMHLNLRIRLPEEQKHFADERRTGVSHVYPFNTVWNFSFSEFRETMQRATTFNTTLAYLQRRFKFATQLARKLVEVLEEIEGCLEVDKDGDGGRRLGLEIGGVERKERFRNRIGLLENFECQVECMQKRNENTIAVLCTVLSQIDSKTQVEKAETQVEMAKAQVEMAKASLQIAQAVRGDAIPMRTIAYVTLLLLPGTFIAAIFGMNFFQFDTSTRQLIVAKSLWQYFAFAVPVTVLTVAIWNYWVRWEKSREGDINSASGAEQWCWEWG
ncbi:uncharacterized protein BDR25DRAFT_345913 [Lindgomyces ingoldianus]|uniref:Uncharacterized protein n=1 Tax=Lindgomyces ingoldianus TaxID=673940 RepID=A0ACB6QFD8_9PLEO|nr:uncharacterized protein BDR25DRAFT_345913 [Lindgomyces ingoldianus]KAF2465709.1 hypothetical protein BDR25DRAFT_345913 [Lindgomyces ingoldianus]